MTAERIPAPTDTPLSPADLVTEFCARWRDAGAEELAAYFTDDGIYHNVPMKAVTGKDAITEFLRGFIDTFGGIEFDVHRQIACGNVVFNERSDRLTLAGRRIELPVAGVFEIIHGRISVWRDYFDMTPITAALHDR
ncbi:limonene-1,2-epoxide hydrolase family protein [Saccharopolyspora shandongensis]|uniref:limonene-1,2-epoxide hydrolase family protein n=1 Tax=Saccharopolyspora shandongensis TaxID=418495 RepID=UPI003407C0A3